MSATVTRETGEDGVRRFQMYCPRCLGESVLLEREAEAWAAVGAHGNCTPGARTSPPTRVTKNEGET